MAAREALHRLVDELPETDLPTAARVLEALSHSADERSSEASHPNRRTARILSPRLAHAEQAADFKKQILEMPPDAGV